MKYNTFFITKGKKPICIGTGLVALDVVVNGNSDVQPKIWAGGSCGNVLTILSYLGWRSYPIARLDSSAASKGLISDITRWKVKTDLITHDKKGSTPIIVEKIGVHKKSGIPWHRFAWLCPNCGSWLPRFKPVLAKDVEQISTRMPKSQVFYFDRISRSSIELAKTNKKQGALIFFEPTGVKDKKLFLECLQTADIVKYSHKSSRHIQELTHLTKIPLEIETFGEVGLRYRQNFAKRRKNSWQIMQSYHVTKLKDAAGAGDWCSAGIIHLLASSGKCKFIESKLGNIEKALRFGQALGSLNCYYEGARGSMYSMTKKKLFDLLQKMLKDSSILESIEEKETILTSETLKFICPAC